MSLNTPTQKRQQLRALMSSTVALQAPGIYDGYGACLAEQAGFGAAYMTGNGVSAALLGKPDVGLVDLTLISDHARRVAHAISIPLICDADTGYGNVVNIRRTIAEFEAAGVAAIHIEDQISPKRCAQMPGERQVLAISEATAKIAAAVAARADTSFVVIARTDCAEALGIDEAIARARAFASVGADAVFVELKANPKILEQIAQIKASVSVPVLVNMDSSPALKALKGAELKAAGIDLGIYPALARGVFGFAMTAALSHLKNTGEILGFADQMFTSAQYNKALGLAEVEQWEKGFTN